MISLLKEFKPALLFLGKFLLLYFLGNIVYGLYITSFGIRPDAVTQTVSVQSAWLLERVGFSPRLDDHPTEPKVSFYENGDLILNVFEGCNGLNVMIVFVAFLFAFGGRFRNLALFIPAGLLIIHFFNLLRIGFLFFLAQYSGRHFYYYHKYFFTATLYLVVFLLWAVWVVRFHATKPRSSGEAHAP